MAGGGRADVAILGSGNIGTDLMLKIMRGSKALQVVAMAGVDAHSGGLARATELGVATTSDGIHGLCAMPGFRDVRLVFDATSAAAHPRHQAVLSQFGVRVVDLTPAALGPRVVPVVNLEAHLGAQTVNMVTCGGQATIPMVAAVARASRVHYAEIVSSIASKSAGPGTRANIDEFTTTTARAVEDLGGARHGKAIIILNPAEPPLLMRNTVFCRIDEDADRKSIRASVADMVKRVASYVPGYRLKQDVQFDPVASAGAPGSEAATSSAGLKISIFLEVSGAGHYLPPYAGNLDIMTSAALATAERLVS